jgi:hypothetical protein
MTKELISIHKLCEHYQIPDSFFEELQQFELIPFETTTDEPMIDASVLPEVEKFMRLRFDLNINMEGIDVINNLLQQIQSLQNEIDYLKRRLRLYEDL